MTPVPRLQVLFEDNHLLAVNKPAGWPTTHFDGTTETIDRAAKMYLKDKYGKPGNVFLGVVHRLDRVTSGVLLFARTSKAAGRLSEQFRDGTVTKEYWAVVPTHSTTSGDPLPDAGTLDDVLAHDDAAARVRVLPTGTAGGSVARLTYRVVGRHGGRVAVVVHPITGRKHQIRVQFASRGYPLWGDVKYGGPKVAGFAIGLHARRLTFAHPTTGTELVLTAPVPDGWATRFAPIAPADA